MSNIIQFSAKLKPSTLMKRMRAHFGDVSEGSQVKVMAKRIILGKRVTFFENGLRVVEDKGLSEDDEFNSEVLRLAHASLLVNDAVGDREACYVDARKNPVEVVIWGMPANVFVKKAKTLMRSGQLDTDFVLGSPLRQTREFENERNVRLFGR